MSLYLVEITDNVGTKVFHCSTTQEIERVVAEFAKAGDRIDVCRHEYSEHS